MTTPERPESDLGWALGTVMRSYLRGIDEVVADVPGGPRGYQVLAAAGRGEASSQLALAQHLGVDRTVMTYLLDDLEAAGLVERRPDPADRRARRVGLTPDGSARLCTLERRLRCAEERVLAPLAEEERTVLRELLARIALGAAPVNPCQVAEEMQAQDAAVSASRGRAPRRSAAAPTPRPGTPRAATPASPR
ncbi:MarR family winged helix-turn-helix transcriptional regulator [Pseudonocardia broussonetiae]|uniref:MarR family winged helix-turn-helix transcriptional regulator n=1 Tax=Pseudonocardia broussonetiae TaxID=2736640 RepID=UPI001F049B85|nr:MarR family winged helix-turn-helix transcriptional regulator [Pseudonocardia broussonetiae]